MSTRRSNSTAKLSSRPKSAIKSLQGLLRQNQQDKKLHGKMKQQNFHISGHDHDYLAPSRMIETHASFSALPVN